MARIRTIVPINLFILVCLFCVSCSDKNATGNENTLFQIMSSKETGISFNNVVKDTRELNIFNFRNFYNGAGVAIGDINNDGLADVFFTANQGENKLYLNKGNFRFEDISVKAGLKNEGKWYTGVTMTDVNGDGWLDIYICNSGKLGSNKPNDLYINQGNGTFKEEAEKYGLADNGLSTHAAFFDYDHDGDLDCFVLNNSPRSIESFGYNKSIRNIRDTINGDRFYKNDNGKFIDISEEAGIYGSEIGFGLGITVGDLNNDGWEDMYISNDFFERDYLYLNKGNGKFEEVINDAMGHISQGSMGSDMIDINNDGYLDIFTTEMLPESDYKLKTTIKFDDYDVQNARLKNDFHHQFTTNCLQLNNGDGTFSEIAQLAGIDATGWSWGALSFDFDNDGLKDLFVCNGISKDLTDQDFLEFFGSAEVLNKVKGGGFKFNDILDKMPSNKILNYAFVNKGNLQFKNLTDSLGFSIPSFSNGAAYGDLDNDGDLDLVINNENMEAFVYRNRASDLVKNNYLKIKLKGNAPNVNGIGSRVTIYTQSGMQVLEQMPSRGFQSSVDNILHFGLGKTNIIDSLIIKWPNNKYETIKNIKADTLITLSQIDANLSIPSLGRAAEVGNTNIKSSGGGAGVGYFTNIQPPSSATHHENPFIDFDIERLIPKMLSTEGPAIAVADINNDGLEDFFLGNAISDTAKIFIQQKNGTFTLKPQEAFAEDKYFETTAAIFFDVDNDNHKDIILASGGNQAQVGSPYLNVRLYLNDGKSNFIRDTFNFPNVSVNASCIVLCDIDNDGKEDLFIGARSIPGKYGISPSCALLKNEGNGKFSDISSLSPVLKNMGMVTDAKFADINNDGRKELVIAGDWAPITAFNYINGSLKKSFEIPNSSGWWNCIELNDIDDDGDIDIIAGNTGLNSRIKASPDKPAKLYVGDFDKNGQIECLPVYFKTDDKAYPYFMKGELQQQIPSLKKDFLYYADYAGKPIEKIFSKEQLKDIDVLNVEETRSCIYKNDGRGSFSLQALPLMAQLSVTNCVYIQDINGDKKKDIIMAGNFYGLKPQAGRFDASYGTTLIADGKGGYNYIPPSQSGFFVNGEARNIKPVTPNLLLVGMNNDNIYLFKK